MILVVFLLLTISFATALHIQANDQKKESPLFEIRKDRALNQGIDNIIDNIKRKYLRERLFLSPVLRLNDRDNNFVYLPSYEFKCTWNGFTQGCPTCIGDLEKCHYTFGEFTSCC